MKQSLTPKEKSDKKQRDSLKYLINGIKSDWSFKKLSSWKDVFTRIGYDDRYVESNFTKEFIESRLDFPSLKTFCEKVMSDLNVRLSGNFLEGSAINRKIKGASYVEEEIKEKVTDILSGRGEQDVSSNSEVKGEGMGKDTVQTRSLSVSTDVCEETKGQKVLEEPEPDLTSSNNYGLVTSPNESPSLSLLWFQKKAISELLRKIEEEKRSGILLILDAGYGKTFIIMGVVRRLLDKMYHADKTISPIPYLYVTPSTILEQTERIAKNFFNIHEGIDLEILNIEALRSKTGKFWIREECKIVDGQEDYSYVWKPMIHPIVVFLDEAQKAKRSSSSQAQIINAYNDIPRNNCLVSFSATPFATVSQAKYFAVSTHRPLGARYGFPEGTVLTNANWPTYAALIAHPSKPDEYNEAAIERLMEDLKDWIVEPKGIRPQFRPNNMVKKVSFPDAATKEFYEKAWHRFLEEMAKAKKEVDEGRYRFVILLKYAMAAELSKAKLFVDEMIASSKRGKAPVCAVKFKGTIIAMVQEFEKRGIGRDQISLIWGGGQTQLTKKEKAKNLLKKKADELKEAGVDIDELMETMELDKVEDRELLDLPEHLNLGAQSLEDRQIEIDNFQCQKTLFCIYTFKAGGVGLSLPHSDEMTEFKCRRKESGYVFVEDIEKVPTRPRELFSSVTYSEIDMTQSLKRCARIVSLSVTDQTIFVWKNTIEEDIYGILMHKLKSLDKVTKMASNWMEIIVSGGKGKEKFENE